MYFKEKRSWMIPPEPVAEDQIKETQESEFVIIGAGYAGVFCARKLIEAGAKVTLLEKARRENYKSNIMGGSEYAVFNSKFGLAKGIPEYDPIDFMLEYQKRTANRCNPDLIRLIAYNSGEAFDWFIEPLSQELKDHIRVFNFPGPDLFRGDTNGYKSFAGTMFFDKPPAGGDQRKSEWTVNAALMGTLNMIESKGVNVSYGTAGEYLEKNKEGRVTGVIARNFDNEYLRFNASKGVVLSAGDFGGNKEMFWDLLDEFSEITQNGERYKNTIYFSPRDGSGIRMGLWAGGRLEPGPRGGMYIPQAGRAGSMFYAPFLKMNVKGKRYSNEGIAGGMMAAIRGSRQPEGLISTVWDSNWKETLRSQSYDHGCTYFSPTGQPMVNNDIQKALAEKEQRKANRAKGIEEAPAEEYKNGPKGMGWDMFAADTLGELADLLGYKGEYKANFLASIERYNELCRKGRDEDYAKDPQHMHEIKQAPFFGTRMLKDAGHPDVTEVGLMVDENQQVIDELGEPIPGLYASGQCAGEVFPLQYCPPMSGSGIGTCTTLGYALGKYLATL